MKKFTEWMKLKEEEQKAGINKKNPDEIKSDMEIKNAIVNAASTGQDPKKALQNKIKQDSTNPNKTPEQILKTTNIINKINQEEKPKPGTGSK